MEINITQFEADSIIVALSHQILRAKLTTDKDYYEKLINKIKKAMEADNGDSVE